MKKLFLISLVLSQVTFAQSPWFIKTSFEYGDRLQDSLAPYSACSDWAWTLSDSFAIDGKRASRFELRATDDSCGFNKRAEFYVEKKAYRLNFQWYALAIYKPAWTITDSRPSANMQWHQCSSCGDEPPLSLWDSAGQTIVYRYLSQTNNPLLKTKYRYYIGPTVYGEWVYWVWDINWSAFNDGYIKLYRNGILVLDLSGPTHNLINGVTEDQPYLKGGIYKWGWSVPNQTFWPDLCTVYADYLAIGKKGFGLTIADFPTPLIVPKKKNYILTNLKPVKQ